MRKLIFPLIVLGAAIVVSGCGKHASQKSKTAKASGPESAQERIDVTKPLAKPAPLPAKATANDVMDRMLTVYKSVNSLKLDAELVSTMSVDGQKQSASSPLAVRFIRPNKLYVETGKNKSRSLTIMDGKKVYSYMAAANMYATMPAPKSILTSKGNSGSATLDLLGGRKMQDIFKNAKLVGEEKLKGEDTYILQRSTTPPYFLGMGPKGAVTAPSTMVEKIWVGKNDYLIKQLASKQTVKASALQKAAKAPKKAKSDLIISQTTLMKQVKVNTVLPANTFKFIPPKGSKLYQQPKAPKAMTPGGPNAGQQVPPPPAQGELPKTKDMVGAQAPDFSLSTNTGSKVSLADYKSKPVVVLFWAAMSPQSEKAMPEYQKAYADLKKQGVEIIAISLDGKVDKVMEFTKAKGLTFPVATDYKQAFGVAVSYSGGRLGLPTSYVVGKDGKIKGTIAGALSAPKIVSKVESLVK